MRMSVTRAAGLLVFRRLEGSIQYLLLRASYGGRHWTPPKGHVDPGESEWTTALRETREEAGLTTTDLDVFEDIKATLVYKVDGIDKTVVYWLARLRDPTKEVQLSDEHTDLRWSDVEESKRLYGRDDFAVMLDGFHQRVMNMNA